MISSFFTVDYRDGRVLFSGKNYPAGVFAIHLLNQFYINDTAARIAVFRDELNFHILRQLRDGYLNITEFVKTGTNTLEALKALPKLRPFDGVNTEEIRNAIAALFTENVGQEICNYFAAKAKLSLLPQEEIAAGTAERIKAAADFSYAEQKIEDIRSVLRFFDSLADDLILAHGKLTRFCNHADEAERLDEAHLLPLALEIFVEHFTQNGRYISVKKNVKSKSATLDSGLLPNLQKIILAGEVLTKKLTRALWDKFPGVQVINGYGPTEGTVLLTCCEITEKMVEDMENELPIGRILDGGICWLEDSEHRPMEMESGKGELVVCSDSISKGYFKNPEITEKHFYNSESGWAYRTGDMVYAIGKNIYYCGRIDFQIKLNGYRIELDDISANLNKVPLVVNNVVLPVYRDGRVAYIAAFVVLGQESEESTVKMGIKIRKALSERIPSYMVPKKVIVLPEFPLNTNGKIDRKKLTEMYL